MTVPASDIISATQKVNGGDGPVTNRAKVDGNRRPVAEYADMYSVALDEAARRLELEDLVGGFNASLQASLGKAFGGLWVTHTPAFRVHVGVLGTNQAAVVLSLAPPKLAGMISTETVPNSLADLDAALASVATSLDSVGVHADLEQSLPSNSVISSVNTADVLVARKGIEAAARVPGSRVAVPTAGIATRSERATDGGVRVSLATRAPSEPAASVYGGLSMSECTAGFSVKHRDGRTGIATAGHCDSTQTFTSSGIATTYVGQYFTGSGDAQWHRASGHTFKPWIYDGVNDSTTPYYQVITNEASGGLHYVGKTVCKYGKTTYLTCAPITSTGVRPGYVPNAAATFVKATRRDGKAMALPGDSGGPVFVGGVAYGLVSGYAPSSGSGRGKDMIYMKVDYLDKLGLHVIGRAG